MTPDETIIGTSLEAPQPETANEPFVGGGELGAARPEQIGQRPGHSLSAARADSDAEEALKWLPQDAGTANSRSEALQRRSLPRSGATESTPETIVVVDDKADMRQYVADLMGREFRVVPCADAESAVATIRELRPALVLSDILMPGNGGLDLLKTVRGDSELSGTPIILLSDHAGEEAEVEGLRAGADDYLVKPFTARELQATVRAHIRVAKIRREAAEREAQLRAEAELERRRLHELLAQAPAGIGLLSGPEHRWTYVNDLYVRITGRQDASDFLGKTVRDSLPEIEGQVYLQLLDQVYASGVAYAGREAKVTLNRAPGGQPEEVYFNFVYQPILNPEGKTDGILVHVVEVTDHVLARRAVEINEERLRLAQEAAQIGTWEWAPGGKPPQLSPQLFRVFGLTPDDPDHPQTWSSRVDPQDREKVACCMEEGYRSGAMDFEYRYLHPQLGLRWLGCKGRREPGRDQMFGVVMDITDRVQAEHAVRQSEERLRAIIDTTPDCVKIVAPDGTIRQMNAAGLKMVGAQSAGQVVGRQVCDLIAAEDRDRFRAFNEKICRGERGFLEFEIVALDGSRRHMETHAVPLRDLDGTTVHLAVTRDETQRKHNEEALRQRELEFRALADAMPQLAWMARPDGHVFWYNQRWYEYTGTSAEEMEGWGWQSVHDPAALPRVLEEWKRSIDSRQPFEMTFPLRRADGEFRPFLTRAVPVRDSAGNITRWLGTNTDVSPEVRIQQELERSQARLQTALTASQRLATIIESSDDAIVSKDLRGIITSWNPAAERIFEYSEQEMIGRSIKTIIPPELQHDEDRILATIARGERIEHFETYRRTKSGKLIDVSLTIFPVRDDAGNVVGAAKIARDITQRKKTERALHITERLASVGRLASTIAHEINNPLEAITNLVYLARENTLEDETRQLLEHAEQELARVSLLARQTLGFYRETKGVAAKPLGELLPPLISIFASRAGNKAITIEKEILSDPPIECIPGEIRQLFANLLNNSIDAVDHGGRIRVRVAAARERSGQAREGVRLTVADSGLGIPPAIRAKLFEPFFTTKRDVGTGLGLWVCQNIVRKHEGRISVRSSAAPSRSWTVFSVFLPAKPQTLLSDPQS